MTKTGNGTETAGFTSDEVQIAKKKAINTLISLLGSPQEQIRLDAAKLLLDYIFRA
jgi:hypothetical protein